MIVIDSSIWIDFFSRENSSGQMALREVIAQNTKLAVLPLIVCEVLMGFKSDAEFRSAKKLLSQVDHLFPSRDAHYESAALYRALKRKWITVRGTIDCMIAQTCLEHGADLLTKDRDFVSMARVLPLKVIRV